MAGDSDALLISQLRKQIRSGIALDHDLVLSLCERLEARQDGMPSLAARGQSPEACAEAVRVVAAAMRRDGVLEAQWSGGQLSSLKVLPPLPEPAPARTAEASAPADEGLMYAHAGGGSGAAPAPRGRSGR